MAKRKNLTRKQKRAAEIIVDRPDLSHEKAGIKAGYKESGARGRMSHNFRLPHFRAYVDELHRARFPALNRDNVAFRLQEVLEIPVGAGKFNPHARISAAREISRMYGWGKEEVHHTHELEGLEEFTVVFQAEDEVDDGASS
jgi:hypothetical protein